MGQTPMNELEDAPPKVSRNQHSPPRSLQERFDYYTPDRPADGCWLWKGALYSNGYGRIWTGTQPALAHRVSFTLHTGIGLAHGQQLDHLCRVVACVNPAHLEIVTAQENTLRSEGISAKRARQTHCIHGHPFEGDNLRILYRNGKVRGRACRACARMWQAKYDAAKRG